MNIETKDRVLHALFGSTQNAQAAVDEAGASQLKVVLVSYDPGNPVMVRIFGSDENDPTVRKLSKGLTSEGSAIAFFRV